MNQLDLRQRVAVITGAARGIGYAAARRALQSGAAVSLWDVDGEKADSAARALSSLGTVSSERVELTDRASVEAAAARTVAAHGQIDILVNNAGIAGGNGLTWELDPDVWRRVIEVNLVGCFLTCRAVIPHMLARGYGRIVNIASIAGKEGNPNASHYSASKAGPDRVHEVAWERARPQEHPGQLHHAGRREYGDFRADEAGAHRLHARAHPDGPVRRGR